MAPGRAARRIVQLALVLLAAARATPARAQSATEVLIRGVADLDSGHSTVVAGAGPTLDLDFGDVNPLWGQPRTGERVPARDGSGIYLVGTLEVALNRTPSPHAASTGHKARRIATGRATVVRPREAVVADRAPPFAIPSDLEPNGEWTTAMRNTEVAIRVEGTGVDLRYAPGTSADWGAGGNVGTPLGPMRTVLFTARGDQDALVHQIALFLPAGTTGVKRARIVYEVVTR
ncbi:MAG: hypothetical protein JRI25_11130 [Deltaproteobacteria bacterium]|nr:hypothetical protein [Deltaproteobacteria bacterium]